MLTIRRRSALSCSGLPVSWTWRASLRNGQIAHMWTIRVAAIGSKLRIRLTARKTGEEIYSSERARSTHHLRAGAARKLQRTDGKDEWTSVGEYGPNSKRSLEKPRPCSLD